MAGKQAKTLSQAQVRTALIYIGTTRNCIRDRVLFLLSAKSGLRAAECAQIRWSMAMDAVGGISEEIALEDCIAKKKSGRTIPLNNDLRLSLIHLYELQKPSPDDYIILSERGGAMSANTVVHWFKRLYSTLGYVGCSSHTGRRSFITNAARKVSTVGGSIRDVQELAGHKSLQMTSSYIEGNTEAKRQLVNLV